MTVNKNDPDANSRPLILAIETATQCGSVALLAGEICLAENTLNSSTTHSRRITSQLENMMTECSVGWQDLDCIAVSQGPGSFTGLRIGLSTAKGLAMACNTPLIGVPTLDALATQIWGHPGMMVCPVLDARKKEVYCALYRCDASGRPILVSEYLVKRPDELVPLITERTIFVGNGIDIYGEFFRKELNEKFIPAPSNIFMPRAATIGVIAGRKFSENSFGDPATMVPIYVRHSEAEVSLAIKKASVKNL